MNIVFDLDGTLIDSAPDIQAVASGVLARRGMAGLELHEVRSFIGQGAAVFVQKMMVARQMDTGSGEQDRVLEEFLADYESAVDLTAFYPGVPEVLESLARAGHSLALCTNKPEGPARAVMRHMGMDALFTVLVAGDMLASRKPEPAMLLHAIDALGGGPALYVGDSETDAQTAERAEIPFALYTQGYRKTPVSELAHNWAFDDFSELPAIVRAAEAGA